VYKIPAGAHQRLRFRLNQGEVDVARVFHEEFGLSFDLDEGDSPHQTANLLVRLAEWLSEKATFSL